MSPATADAPSTALARPPSVELAEPRGFVQLTTLAQAREFAEILVKSDLVPKDYIGKPGNAIVAMQMGMEIGLPPLQAIQSIAVVNGRPSLWGDGLRALILSAPDLQDIQETDDGETATCSITRGGRSPVVRTFSMADAKLAGLAAGNVWAKYPKRMRQNRAFAFAARDAYADRLRGIASADEQFDSEPSISAAPPPSEPRRLEVIDAQPATSSPPATAPAGPDAPQSTARTSEPPASAPAPASSAPATNGGNGGAPLQVARGVFIKGTKYVPPDAKRSALKEHWQVETSDGLFVTMDEALYKSAVSCEGTDHRFALTYKLAKSSVGDLVRVLKQIDLDEGGAQ